MSQTLPVSIIGGFLGSGKTTLVNHLLRHANGVRLAVLVNDFGELPIDADLIESQDGNVISLSGGCVCCSYGDDLSLSLQQLQAMDKLPDHILIEASGVALPGAIGSALSLSCHYQLEGIVVLADATTIKGAASEKYIGDTIERQLNDADVIILNKLDLLAAEQATDVRDWLGEHYAGVPVVDAVFSTIEPTVFFDVQRLAVGPADSTQARSQANQACSPQGLLQANQAGSLQELPQANQVGSLQGLPQANQADSLQGLPQANQAGSLQGLPQANHDHAVSTLFSSVNLIFDEPVDVNALAAALADKQCGLVRTKGFVLDQANVLKTVQVVGRRWSVTDAPANASPGLVCIAQAPTLSADVIRLQCMRLVEKTSLH